MDFEFIANPGERPLPICCVARELRSGREEVRWLEEPGSPILIPDSGVVLAYFASAELGCFLALGWKLPLHVLDLFTEFRLLTNGRENELSVEGKSLLAALSFFGLAALDPDVKHQWRSRILAGGPYTEEERLGILDYCRSDVVALEALLTPLVEHLHRRSHWLAHALLRGRYMRAVAGIERNGTPVDRLLFDAISTGWPSIQQRLVSETQTEYPFYVDGTLKQDKLVEWAVQQGIWWPRTASGRLALDEDTLKSLGRAHVEVEPLRQLLGHVGKLRVGDVAVGKDARNRVLISPFSAQTGRNQPSGKRFIFAPSVWIRSLIRPEPGTALAYIDYASQEIGIAAALSGDTAMQRAYLSGDPYLSFAVDAGLAPVGATKATHKRERERCKGLVLGTLYGMGEATLATNLGIYPSEARRLLSAHRRVYSVFWAWAESTTGAATLQGHIDTVFGWRRYVTSQTRPTSLLNHPMQSHGAEILRLACCFLTEAGIRVCAPVHDAVLIEAAADEIDDVVLKARSLMERASSIVLGGVVVRTEADFLSFPDRYVDPRGVEMWEKVLSILDDATDTV